MKSAGAPGKLTFWENKEPAGIGGAPDRPSLPYLKLDITALESEVSMRQEGRSQPEGAPVQETTWEVPGEFTAPLLRSLKVKGNAEEPAEQRWKKWHLRGDTQERRAGSQCDTLLAEHLQKRSVLCLLFPSHLRGWQQPTHRRSSTQALNRRENQRGADMGSPASLRDFPWWWPLCLVLANTSLMISNNL